MYRWNFIFVMYSFFFFLERMHGFISVNKISITFCSTSFNKSFFIASSLSDEHLTTVSVTKFRIIFTCLLDRPFHAQQSLSNRRMKIRKGSESGLERSWRRSLTIAVYSRRKFYKSRQNVDKVGIRNCKIMLFTVA